MKQKLSKILERDKILYLILALSALFRIIFFNHFNRIWWDSGVYVGIAKYLFSAGELGIFEQIRPFLFPFLTGIFWKIGISPVFMGKIIVLIAGLFCILLTYKIAEQIFDKRIALMSAFFMSIAPTFAFFGFKPLTDVLSLCFGLAAIYFFVKKRHALTGLFCALAFLTRLTLGLFFGIILMIAFTSILFYLIKKKKRKAIKEIKNILIVIVLFVIFTAPYFIFSYIRTGSFLEFMHSASAIIRHVGLSIHEPWHYYFRIVLFENFFVLFSIIGAIVLVASIFKFIKTMKHRYFSVNINYLLLLLLVFLPFLYHSYLARKEPRYIIIFLPFLLILTSKGLMESYHFFKGKGKSAANSAKAVFYLLLILLFIVSMIQLFVRYEIPHSNEQMAELETYYSYFQDSNQTILSSGPELLFYVDKAQVIYFIRDEMYDNYSEFNDIALNTCELYCAPSDEVCRNNQERFIIDLKENRNQEFYAKVGFCEYYIFIKEKRD